MTASSEPADRRATRRREKLGPDPDVRRAILTAASEIVREQGVSGLNVAEILERCHLGTRAFYRHFRSKDELVSAVLARTAAAESRRLRRKMASTSTTVEAVAAWIEGRLDLAFDSSIGSDLRQVSVDAQSLMFTTPGLVQEAFGEMMKPLVQELTRGLAEGVFHDIDPVTDASMIQGAVWACTERQWVTGDGVPVDVRARVLRACLRALGVVPQSIADVLATRGHRQGNT